MISRRLYSPANSVPCWQACDVKNFKGVKHRRHDCQSPVSLSVGLFGRAAFLSNAKRQLPRDVRRREAKTPRSGAPAQGSPRAARRPRHRAKDTSQAGASQKRAIRSHGAAASSFGAALARACTARTCTGALARARALASASTSASACASSLGVAGRAGSLSAGCRDSPGAPHGRHAVGRRRARSCRPCCYGGGPRSRGQLGQKEAGRPCRVDSTFIQCRRSEPLLL